ncbi:protein Hook homolog 1 [Aethina tumida]|uniref:protein Hook homolog 1 n=1 Tax=Aethina tumida TaxID=116153 RepID=UPI0021490B1D|nr:protein Hook homolog 1 [Aethina tumida]
MDQTHFILYTYILSILSHVNLTYYYVSESFLLMEGFQGILAMVHVQDLEFLNRIIQNVYIKSPINVTSWLFPTKDHNFVNEMLKAQDLMNLTYVNGLELLVDRLYTIINLITGYIKSYSNLQERLLIRPSQLSLSFSVDLLWKTIETLTEKSSPIVPNYTGVEKVCNQTQTDQLWLNRCDSCSSAVECIKNMVCSFEEYDVAISAKRTEIRSQLYELTQFGCMLKTTNLVQDSLQMLFEKLRQKQQECDVLKAECDDMQNKLKEQCASLDLLSEELSTYKNNKQFNDIKIMSLKNENDLLTEESRKLKERFEKKKKEVGAMEKEIADFKRNQKVLTKLQAQNLKLVEEKKELETKYEHCSKAIDVMHTNSKNYQKKITKLLTNQDRNEEKLSLLIMETRNIANAYNTLQAKYNNDFKDFSDLGRMMEESGVLLQSLDGRISSVQEDCTNTNVKLEKVLKTQQEHANITLDRFKNIQEKVSEYLIKAHMKYDADEKPKKELKGNPIEDMTCQIEENKKNIKNLQDENMKLECFLQRLSKFKSH